MKTRTISHNILLFLAVMAYCFPAYGQKTAPSWQANTIPVTPDKLFETWVYPPKGYKGKPRMLVELKDSAILLSESRSKAEYSSGDYEVSKVDIRKIDVLKIRRKGAGAAIVIGGISGLILGAVITIAYANAHTQPGVLGEPVPSIESFIPIPLSTVLGFGTGIFLASKIKIPINRSQATYELNKARLNEYAILGNKPLANVKGGTFSILPDTIPDADGNYYHTLALGGQVWMAGNLKESHYRNGDAINEVQGNLEWGASSGPATCWYLNENTGTGIYGRLYNWNAVADSRGLCPKGWHVPSMPEWESLVACLGGGTEGGKQLLGVIRQKADSSNTTSKNSNSFAFRGGFRFNTGRFSAAESPACQWWSSTQQDQEVAKSFQLGNSESGIFFTGSDKKSGLSVRCLRD